MTPTEVRERVRRDHARLRGMLTVVESLALRVLRGDEELASACRLKGEELRDFLLAHLEWEEQHLVPVLNRCGLIGKRRAGHVLADHREQRQRIAELVRSVTESQYQANILASGMLDFTRWLERDMAEEEARALDPALFRRAGFSGPPSAPS